MTIRWPAPTPVPYTAHSALRTSAAWTMLSTGQYLTFSAAPCLSRSSPSAGTGAARPGPWWRRRSSAEPPPSPASGAVCGTADAPGQRRTSHAAELIKHCSQNSLRASSGGAVMPTAAEQPLHPANARTAAVGMAAVSETRGRDESNVGLDHLDLIYVLSY